MEIVSQIVRAGLTVGVLVVITLIMAALFMIIFSVATGIDDQVQE